MSFAAEPYGVFVDDLVSGLTGGIVREAFVFVPEAEPFRLGFPDDFLAATVRVHGQVDGAFHRFAPGTDYQLENDGTIAWIEGDPGVPRPGASWPDRGTTFYASYERKPEVRPAPVLTDRNPGSVVRTMAESFAREYAVLSKQLELVYQAGFLATAQGRDLDQVAALVGVSRRTRTFAAGEVVFSRSTPAPADVFIPAGTQISSSQPPPITVETTDVRTLRAGTVSVAIPVQSLVPGPAGLASAGTLTVIRRPILGVEASTNPQPMQFGAADETDVAMRARAGRALETGGRATLGALIGALTSIEGIRAQDVRAVEDHLAFAGTVKLTVAAELDPTRAQEAAQVIEDYRPAGIRVLHNLPLPAAPSRPPSDGGGGGGAPSGPQPPGAPATGSTMFPVGCRALVTPTSSTLTAVQKANLVAAAEAALRGVVGDYGIGDPVIYNHLVAAVMDVDGVYDVLLELYVDARGAAQAGRQNLMPRPPDTRPELTTLAVSLRGALIALDVTVDVQRLGLAAASDRNSMLAAARDHIAGRLTLFVNGAGRPATITADVLRGALTATADYRVKALSYTAELLEQGLRLLKENVPLTPAPEQQLWIRTLSVTEQEGA